MPEVGGLSLFRIFRMIRSKKPSVLEGLFPLDYDNVLAVTGRAQLPFLISFLASP